MSNSYSIGKLFNIPVRVHITLLIFLPLLTIWFAPAKNLPGLAYGLLGSVCLFGSIVLHEVGHSLVARAKGSRIQEILLLPIGGMARLDRLPRRPADEILTALAGPAVSFILGLLGILVSLTVFRSRPLAFMFCFHIGALNIMLALFNLIPSFPMDGGRVFRAALTPRMGRLAATQLAAKIGRVFACIFGFFAIRPLFDGGRPDVLLLAIAFFIYQSAGAEARMAEAETARMRQRAHDSSMWKIPDADVKVSPPPYAQTPPEPPRPRSSRGFFGSLFNKRR